jgi:hypothetical protein
MRIHGFGILMILASVALAFGLGATAIGRLLRGRPARLGRLALVGAGWTVLYLGTLVTVSLASDERVLGWESGKRFCGFYLDCHSQIAVTGVEVLDTLGGVRADGRFHVVTLRIGSDAGIAHMRLTDPHLTVTDGARCRVHRSAAGEAALARARGPQRPLTDSVGPGGAYLTTVVFDVPADLPEPRLAATEGWWADRLVEFFLIGDEDSFLHARTTIRLTS